MAMTPDDRFDMYVASQLNSWQSEIDDFLDGHDGNFDPELAVKAVEFMDKFDRSVKIHAAKGDRSDETRVALVREFFDANLGSEELVGDSARLSAYLDDMYSSKELADRHVEMNNARLVSDRKDLRGIDFSGQDISGSYLSGRNFSGSDFSNAKFHDIVFSGSNFTGCKLDGAKFNRGVRFKNCTFNGVDFGNINGAPSYSVTFDNCSFIGAKFEGAPFGNFDFEHVQSGAFARSDYSDVKAGFQEYAEKVRDEYAKTDSKDVNSELIADESEETHGIDPIFKDLGF